MGAADLPLLNQIKGRLAWLDDRQRVIAQNVANADTPGYGAQDLKAPPAFADALRGGSLPIARTHPGHAGGRVEMMRTSSAHIAPPSSRLRYDPTKAPDSETTLDGNSVVVEEQMLKMAESRMAYDAAIGFYQKSMQMIRMAAKKPGV